MPTASSAAKRQPKATCIGKVGNFNGHERGTTYHLHFDMQVPTKIGWVFVNPYATLVTAYERLIGARGTEIKDGDVAPPTAVVPPMIEHPDLAASATPKAQTEAGEPVEVVPVRAKTHKARKAQKHTPRHRRHRKRGHSAGD